MDITKIKNSFENFSKTYDEETYSAIWDEQSKQFRDFWNLAILDKSKSLIDADLDEIIRILDTHAKGNTKNNQAVANVMIPQGVWQRMFNEIKNNEKLRDAVNKILQSEGETLEHAIDNLYLINKDRKNSLTGRSANALNTMLFAYNPRKYLSVVSLNDRRKIIEVFNFKNSPDFDKDSQGKKVVGSNRAIIDGFKSLGIEAQPRTLSYFLYREIKDEWRGDVQVDDLAPTPDIVNEPINSDPATFYMESELEDFLITNWDKTELGKENELIEEDGTLLSQQYRAGNIGIIDILARDKKTKQYVVIELKKNQSSDETVGQLTRYMGWVEEKLSNGKMAKGIIIAAKFDDRLYYALKKVKDVEVYQYQVDFKLKEFKKPTI